MKSFVFFILSTFAIFLSPGHAAEGENLLVNPDFEQNGTGSLSGWKISPRISFKDSPELAEQLECGPVEEAGGNCLMIATREFVKAHVWWQQDLMGSGGGGTVYEVSVEVKGVSEQGSKYATLEVGIHFLDADGHWLGFQAISTPELSETWKLIKGKITVPDGTATMGLRLGADFNGEIKVFFRHPALSEVQ